MKMTDKLPVVGKKYRLQKRYLDNNNDKTTCENKKVIVTKIKEREGDYLIHYKDDDGITNCLSSISFLGLYYEEDSEDNLQKTKEVKVNKLDEALKKLYTTENASSDIEGSIRLIIEFLRQANETLNPVDLEKKEVNKIDRALNCLQMGLSWETREQRLAWFDLTVERFFAREEQDAKINKEYERLQKEYRDNLSKEEPKIDMKEKRVEPVSIWKDVSELPKVPTDCFIKTKPSENLGVCFGVFQPSNTENKMFYTNENKTISKAQTDKYCTLTDFVNSIEELKRK